MNKILIITYYWPPKKSPGVLRWYYFSRYLPLYGYRPIIFTPLNSKNEHDDKIDLIKLLHQRSSSLRAGLNVQ